MLCPVQFLMFSGGKQPEDKEIKLRKLRSGVALSPGGEKELLHCIGGVYICI